MAQHDTSSVEAGPTEAHLRLLCTSDLHMQLMPHDYIADRPVANRGLALAAAEIDAARAEAANTLLFDIGDAFEGSPVDERLARALPPAGHPMANALRAAGFDAATLGNHDFNHGLPALERILDACEVPLVLSNIVRRLGATPDADLPLVPPALLLARRLLCADGTRHPVRIGVLGVAPPQTLEWDGDQIGTALAARDCVDAAAYWAADLRRNGADVVIVLCHSGIGSLRAEPMMEHAAVPIAALPQVDVVLAGHAHGLFPDPDFLPAPDARTDPDARPSPGGIVDPIAGRLHGKPCVMPGCRGTHVGLVDLRLSFDARQGWRIASHESALRPVTARSPHAGVAAVLTDHHGSTLSAVQRPVGHSPVRLATYFAQVADVPAVRIVNAAQTDALRRALAGHPEADLPLLSASAPLRAGGSFGHTAFTDVPAGQVALRHIADLYPYQNSLVALPITGAELRAWLERSASVFRTIPTGARRAPLLDPDHPAYVFDVVSGVTYRIDLGQPARSDAAGRPVSNASRIVDLRHRGRTVSAQDRFVLATNSYRLGGGGGFPRPAAAPIPLGAPVSVREILTRFIEDGGAARLCARPAWGFVAQPNTTATFITGREAHSLAPPGSDLPEGSPIRALGRDGRGEDGGALTVYEIDLARAHQLGPDAT